MDRLISRPIQADPIRSNAMQFNLPTHPSSSYNNLLDAIRGCL